VSRGRVVWITGLAGSGKTTVATALARRLRTRGRAVVVLDGDELRRTIATDLGYGFADRRCAAERYARLAAALARQGLVVLVATISMFEAVRCWSRRHAPRYLEVYLRRPLVAERRRPGPQVRRAHLVVGRDVPFEAPRRPDLVFDVADHPAAGIVARLERRLVHGR
jgi:adenylylsulfate kinase